MSKTASITKTLPDSLALLDRVRLTPHELAEARAKLLQAEAIADFLYFAWNAAKRVAGAIARRSAALANSYADRALRSSTRQRDRYLAQARDRADFEHRYRAWQAPRNVPMLTTRP